MVEQMEVNLSQFEPGNYIFWFYETDEECQELEKSFIEASGKRNEKLLIIYKNDYSSPPIIQIATKEPQHAAESTSDSRVQIVALEEAATSDQPENRILELIEKETYQAVNEGFSGLAVIVTSDPSLRAIKNTRELITYELALEERFTGKPCQAIWLLDIHNISSSTILDIVITQPRLGIHYRVYKNPVNLLSGELIAQQDESVSTIRKIEAILARAEMENNLLQDDFWLRSIIDSLDHFACALLPDGTLIEANQHALEYAGIDRAQVIGKPFWEAYWWNYDTSVQKNLRESIINAAQGEVVHYEVNQRVKEESFNAVDLTISPVNTRWGNVAVLIVQCRDISKKREIERQLFERERLMETALSGAPIILSLIDKDGIIRLSTGKGLDGLRLKQGERIGRSVYDLNHDHPEIINYFERCMRGETISTLIERDDYTYETRYTPYLDENEQIQGVVVMATDITRHRRVEDELYSSQEWLRSIFEKSEVGIVLQDLDGNILKFNPAFQAMLGFPPDELMTKSFSDFTYPGDLPAYKALYQQLKFGKRNHFRIEKRYVRKDGKIIWGRLNASLLRNAEGLPEAVTLMVEDITVYRELQAELSEVQHRLMSNQEEQRLRIAQDLHDGPLQELYGMAFNLNEAMEMVDNPALKEKMATLQHSLEKEMHDLRVFCTELRPPTLAPFGLEKSIRSHAETFRGAHPGISIQLDLQRDGQQLPEEIRLALYRIYQETVNNVVKHAEASEIQVEFRFNQKSAELKISDNGKGFEVPMRWVQIARQGHFGLVGARERAEAIGGLLQIQSKPGEGTTVQVEVPIIPGKDASQLNQLETI